MNHTESIDVPDYRVDTAGAITVTEAGLAIDHAYREAERAFDTLQHSWAGACLAGLFVRHPWLQSMRATLSASAEYDDQGGTYRSISNAVMQVVPVADAALPDAVLDEGAFDELGETRSFMSAASGYCSTTDGYHCVMTPCGNSTEARTLIGLSE